MSRLYLPAFLIGFILIQCVSAEKFTEADENKNKEGNSQSTSPSNTTLKQNEIKSENEIKSVEDLVNVESKRAASQPRQKGAGKSNDQSSNKLETSNGAVTVYEGKKPKSSRGKSKTKNGKQKSKLKGKDKGKGKWRNVQSDAMANDITEEMSNAIDGGDSRYDQVPMTCDDLHCRANGLCVPDTVTGKGVRCQCPLGTEGEVCERDVIVQYPRFIGSGYISFPQLHMAYKELSVAIEFRPDTANGLLLFSSHYPDGRLDFFSIALLDGHAELRFDCGSGMAQITSPNKVELGQWNNITVHRADWFGWIELNGGPRVEGRSKGLFSRITFLQDLYLGGYKDIKLIADRTGMQWAYIGCVRYLEVNRKIYDMRKGAFVGDAIGGVDVTECSAHACYGIKCQNGGSCVVNSADTGVCLCPLGTGGDRCETKIDIYVPRFRGTSYLQFIGLRQNVMSFTEVELVIKPTSRNGLIFYNGYTADQSGDFISLAIIEGFLEYRFDLGTGPAIIRSRQTVTLDKWHTVRFARTGRDGWLQVDNQIAVHGVAKGGFTQLTLNLDLFVGGHRNFDEVSRSVGIIESFQGCVQKIVINDRQVKLLEDALSGQNVDNCDHPCVYQPCLNGGTCMPALDLYRCTCPVGFENTNCEDRKVRYRYRYKRADDASVSQPITVPEFSGDSYLMYDAAANPDLLKRLFLIDK